MNLTLLFPSIRRIILPLAFSLALPMLSLAYPGGSPAGYTGSPGDGKSCTFCHGGSSATVSNWITSNIPGSGYLPGTQYTITVTVTGTGRKGFEVSPQSPSGTQLGTLIAGTGNHLVGGTKYVTQNSGNNAATATWSFNWTAPAAGTGQVTFYGAFTVGEPNTKLSTLVVDESTASPLSASASATPSAICAGGSSQLNAIASGGSGTYTYQWSSTPPGFSSTLQNPVVSPTVNTQYSVTVSDGSSNAAASTTVSVSPLPYANAGEDTLVPFTTEMIPLHGMAANFSGILWTTSGTGTFSAPNALTGSYTPSMSDKQSGIVWLNLAAQPLSPCTGNATASRKIEFMDPSGQTDPETNALSFSVSPNPSEGMITVSSGMNDRQSCEITVSDPQGKVRLSQIWNRAESPVLSLNLTSFARGVYFVQIRNEHRTATQMLLLY